MPNISGFVFYDPNRNTITTTGIQNVPVAIYNPILGIGAIALTNNLGLYQFSNVPAGTYQIIECWGTLGGINGIVDYAIHSVLMTQPVEKEPPLSAVSVVVNPLADKLDAITPNLLNLVVGLVNITGQNFYDGPIGDKGLTLTGVSIISNNLITAAANGTWGSLPAGTPIGSVAPFDPYPGVTSGFTYAVSTNPPDGSYSITNTRPLGNPGFAWWRFSDHTTGLETGRFILVNGDNPGAYIFQQTVTVLPNTDYLASAWITNVDITLGGVNPKLAFQVVASDGTVLFNQSLNDIPATSIPIWYETGSIFNTGAFTSVTVKVVSSGPFSSSGNDYAVDDVALYQVTRQELLTVEKTAAPSPITVGETIEYTAKINNVTTIATSGVLFKDVLASNLSFVPGSVLVNGSGVGFATADPNVGFNVGNIAGFASTEVKFKAIVLANMPNPIPNIATASYPYLSSQTGDKFYQDIHSNQVHTLITKYNLRQTSIDVIESVAYAQTGLSHILNAEGEKIQKALALDVSPEQLLAINESVKDMVQVVTKLEMVLQQKIKTIRTQALGETQL